MSKKDLHLSGLCLEKKGLLYLKPGQDFHLEVIVRGEIQLLGIRL